MSQNKIVTRYMLLLLPIGIIINIIGVRLAHHFQWIIFLDSIGTVLAAAMGGYLPGIMVGFFSNIINGMSDPITYYYGILSILIAAATVYFTRRGMLYSFKKIALYVLILAFIGGGLGSCLTWFLFGFQFGGGISAPYAIYIHETLHISEFSSQLMADLIIDIWDKVITTGIIVAGIRVMPQSFVGRFPNGVYLDKDTLKNQLWREKEVKSQGKEIKINHSLRTEVIVLIISSVIILGALATGISYGLYKDAITRHYTNECENVVSLMAKAINADEIDEYFAEGDENDSSYFQTEKKLKKIKNSFKDIEYMYVYQMREDGCYVVYDLDTKELKGEPLGTEIDYDKSFKPYIDKLLEGEKIPPIISNDTYGWLLTVYSPLIDSSGHCKAYAAVDVSMEDVITERYTFIIRVISLLFGSAIVLVVLAIWFAERRLIEPVDHLTKAADRFAIGSEAERLQSIENMRELNIHTGNEIQQLYHALSKTMTEIVGYVNTIDSLQENTLFSFANLVESRDNNTGEHIKRTAVFVGIIAKELMNEGKYTSLITPEYIDGIEKAAPLHDVGKIEIPDAILTKPGRLTKEEFDIMKTHAAAGGRIIQGLLEHTDGLSYLWDARDMACYHHERWDGTGYGEGIAGEDIPLSARIMAVADVFDALISKRTYKEALPYTEALEIIISESGSHFDPAVVEAFSKTFEEICKAADHIIFDNSLTINR